MKITHKEEYYSIGLVSKFKISTNNFVLIINSPMTPSLSNTCWSEISLQWLKGVRKENILPKHMSFIPSFIEGRKFQKYLCGSVHNRVNRTLIVERLLEKWLKES